MKKKVNVARWRITLGNSLMSLGYKLNNLCFDLAFYVIKEKK